MQDWRQRLYALGPACNSLRLRLVRDNAGFARPAYIKANLRRIFESEAFAAFAALWLLVHASRFGAPDAAPSNCALGHGARPAAANLAALDRLRDSVEAAVLTLGNGFLAHPKNSRLVEQLRTGALPLTRYFGQLLRLVCRLIFLLAAQLEGSAPMAVCTNSPDGLKSR